MQLALAPDLEKLIREQVESGVYETADEVIRDALRLLKRSQLRRERLETLRREARVGIDHLERGEYVTYSADEMSRLAEEVKSRGRERLRSTDPSA